MKLDKTAFVTGRKEVTVPNGKEQVTLYACEIGYIPSQSILSNYGEDKSKALAELVQQSVIDKDGNHFTLEEVLQLKKEVMEPLLDAALKVNGLRSEEKN